MKVYLLTTPDQLYITIHCTEKKNDAFLITYKVDKVRCSSYDVLRQTYKNNNQYKPLHPFLV